jgi:hypothetical protein
MGFQGSQGEKDKCRQKTALRAQVVLGSVRACGVPPRLSEVTMMASFATMDRTSGWLSKLSWSSAWGERKVRWQEWGGCNAGSIVGWGVSVLREINQAEREMCNWQLNVDPAALGQGSTPRLARVGVVADHL